MTKVVTGENMVNQEKLTEHKLTQKVLFCSTSALLSQKGPKCCSERNRKSESKLNFQPRKLALNKILPTPDRLGPDTRKADFVACEQQRHRPACTNQPAHLCSLISIFVIHPLESMIG